MADNPNPARITDAEWQLWERAREIISGVRLGGIFANKSGYHNTVDANRVTWPGNYSIRFSLDTQRGPSDKARAIDLTMSDTQMRAYTRRLANAAAAEDPRMRPVREFYGTVDSQVVTGRIRDSDGGAYRASTSDSSHLWHIHISFWAAYCADWEALSGVADVLAGLSMEESGMDLDDRNKSYIVEADGSEAGDNSVGHQLARAHQYGHRLVAALLWGSGRYSVSDTVAAPGTEEEPRPAGADDPDRRNASWRYALQRVWRWSYWGYRRSVSVEAKVDALSAKVDALADLVAAGGSADLAEITAADIAEHLEIVAADDEDGDPGDVDA